MSESSGGPSAPAPPPDPQLFATRGEPGAPQLTLDTPQLTLDTASTMAELRQELDRLRALTAQASAAQVTAEQRAAVLEHKLQRYQSRSARAYDAITELREQLEAVRAETAKAGGPPPGPRQAEDFAAVRAPGPATPPALPPARPPGRWLERALRQLARRSAPLAGRLLVVLVPGAEMDQERLVHLLAAGRLRRGRTRTLGEGASFDALRQRLAEPGSIAELRLEPGLSLVLAAVMIDPRWTAGEQFTIAYQLPSGASPGPYLQIYDGLPATVTADADPGQVTATIACPADLLTAVLAGERPAGTLIHGEERPLELVRGWLERAQSD
jgi:hypothetical protein